MKLTFSTKAKKAISALVVYTTLNTTALAAGLPVIDVGAIAQAIAQVNNQVKQIEHMKNQVKAITDNGNFADLLNDPNLRKQINKYLPEGYTDIVQAIHKGDAGALQQIYEQVQKDEQQRRKIKAPERVKIANAVVEAQMIGMIKTLDVRSKSMKNLVNQINRTENAAQKADLMNALQAEQAMIQIDLGKMQIMMNMAQEQRRLAERQAVDEFNKRLTSVR